jgi:hypothetical protein
MAAMRSGNDVPARVWSERGAAATFIVEQDTIAGFAPSAPPGEHDASQSFLDAAATEFLSEAGPGSAEPWADGAAGAEEIDDAAAEGLGRVGGSRKSGSKVRNAVLASVEKLYEQSPESASGPTLTAVATHTGYNEDDVEEALNDQIANGCPPLLLPLPLPCARLQGEAGGRQG